MFCSTLFNILLHNTNRVYYKVWGNCPHTFLRLLYTILIYSKCDRDVISLHGENLVSDTCREIDMHLLHRQIKHVCVALGQIKHRQPLTYNHISRAFHQHTKCNCFSSFKAVSRCINHTNSCWNLSHLLHSFPRTYGTQGHPHQARIFIFDSQKCLANVFKQLTRQTFTDIEVSGNS